MFIDYRERDLIDALHNWDGVPDGMVVRIKNLQVGDVIFARLVDCDEGQQCEALAFDDDDALDGKAYVPLMALERKTCADLAGSIRSHSDRPSHEHWDEQKRRLRILRSQFPSSCIIGALIERYQDHVVNATPVTRRSKNNAKQTVVLTEDALHSALLNALLKEDLKIFHTANHFDSCRMICKTAAFMNKHEIGVASTWSELVGRVIEDPELSTLKKNNWSHALWFRGAVLGSIPGVSKQIAQRIVEQYPDIQSLISGYEACVTDRARRRMLAGIEMTHAKRTPNGLYRRLGESLSTLIYRMIMNVSDGAQRGGRKRMLDSDDEDL